MAGYWIKLYTEILHDPKMARMSDHLWRRTIELFLIAGDNFQDGILPSESDMAYLLRAPLSRLKQDLGRLLILDVLNCSENVWSVAHFHDRQAPMTDAERKRLSRERKENMSRFGHDPVTLRDINVTTNVLDKDKDKDKDKDVDKIKNDVDVFRLFENNICILNGMMSEQLGSAIEDYGKGEVIEAIKIASDNNGRSIRYLLKVLENRKNGIQPGKNGRKKDARTTEQGRSKYEEWEK